MRSHLPVRGRQGCCCGQRRDGRRQYAAVRGQLCGDPVVQGLDGGLDGGCVVAGRCRVHGQVCHLSVGRQSEGQLPCGDLLQEACAGPAAAGRQAPPGRAAGAAADGGAVREGQPVTRAALQRSCCVVRGDSAHGHGGACGAAEHSGLSGFL